MGQLVFCEKCKQEGRQVALGSITDDGTVVVMTWQKTPLSPEFRKTTIYQAISHFNEVGVSSGAG